MQYKVDSYTLEYVESEDKYYISFIDSGVKIDFGHESVEMI